MSSSEWLPTAIVSLCFYIFHSMTIFFYWRNIQHLILALSNEKIGFTYTGPQEYIANKYVSIFGHLTKFSQ